MNTKEKMVTPTCADCVHHDCGLICFKYDNRCNGRCLKRGYPTMCDRNLTSRKCVEFESIYEKGK